MKLDPLSHHLLILSQHFEIYRNLIELEKLTGLSITAVGDPGLAIEFGKECDIVFGEPSGISTILDQLKYLVWVQSSWAGVEPLLAVNLRRDYLLTNVRNVYGPLMSEYVFGYLLMIERRILPRWQSQIAHRWDNRPNSTLKNKLLGLVGVGSIGAIIAATAMHFGMRVYGYTRQSEDCHDVEQYFHGQGYREFAQSLDYLVCTLPGTNETKELVNADFISALPKKAWLINVGRGSTIEELALISALSNGAISGTVLDVFSEEPLPLDHPFWSTPNTYITFHTAAQNNPPDIASIFIENYRRLITGEPLHYQVDFKLGY